MGLLYLGVKSANAHKPENLCGLMQQKSISFSCAVPRWAGVCCASPEPRDPGSSPHPHASVPPVGVSTAWQWEEREEGVDAWVEGLDVAPSLLSLRWGPGVTLLLEPADVVWPCAQEEGKSAWPLMLTSLSLPW